MGHIIPTRPPYIDRIKEFLCKFMWNVWEICGVFCCNSTLMNFSLCIRGALWMMQNSFFCFRIVQDLLCCSICAEYCYTCCCERFI
jgi:hypothetical protein